MNTRIKINVVVVKDAAGKDGCILVTKDADAALAEVNTPTGHTVKEAWRIDSRMGETRRLTGGRKVYEGAEAEPEIVKPRRGRPPKVREAEPEDDAG